MIKPDVVDTVCIIGSNGCIGSFFNDLLSPLARQMYLIDPAYPVSKDNRYCDDLSLMSENDKRRIFSKATLVIFAVATDVFINLLEHVIPFMPEHCVIADTTSTKVVINEFYDRTFAKYGISPQILSLDPLFKPGPNMTTKSVSYISKNTKQPLSELLILLRQQSCDMIETTPEEHDSALSIIQVSVHALVLIFGKTLIDSNISIDMLLKFATPPFRLLLLLLHRIASGVPEVYWDIQYNNVFGKKVRHQLKENLANFTQLIENDQEDEFYSLVEKIKEESHVEAYQGMLQPTFSKINQYLESYFNLEETVE